MDSEEQTAEGGGLCQVTSTLYNAALYAGMEVVERTAARLAAPLHKAGHGRDGVVRRSRRRRWTTWT